MKRPTLAAVACASLITVLALPSPASAGHGNAVGAGLLGFGIGAIVGSALTPQTVYVNPPPPPAPTYYAPAGYGPPPWTPAWYRYCRQIHGPYFDARSGYFEAADGGWYFCQ
jgi:hypothetical protein